MERGRGHERERQGTLDGPNNQKMPLLYSETNFATLSPSTRGGRHAGDKTISELRNYNTVLREVTVDSPVFLTKNGHGRFAIVDIRAYEKLRAELELMSTLAEGEESARKGGWVSMDSAMKKLGV